MGISIPLNAEFIDAQYRLWKSNYQQVSREWQLFFEGFEIGFLPDKEIGICDKKQVYRQSHVDELVYRYRDLGHLLSCLDPLSACPIEHPQLSLGAFRLDETDLDRAFYTPHFPNAEQMTLREIMAVLKDTYCRSVGVEYMHIQDPAERRWLQGRMEPIRNRPQFDGDTKLRIFNKLCQASLFEQFLHAKYLGQKRFSIEGAEVIVAMLDALIHHAAASECVEIILGMAHRGRLNVQVNTLEKPFDAIFCEFEDNYNPETLVGSGDVKYHTGYMADIPTSNNRSIRVLLCSNSSHLESVNPIVEGIARARQELHGDSAHKRVLPLLIHGDAAFSGQGIVFETLNLSQLTDYLTGGTVHLVINNQIGFTTLPEDLRSTRYSTDVAKMLMVPIFHVHAEDPEAAVHVLNLAFDYRMEFGKDVVIDVVCYRRYGHNEGDEPYYTQPQMYDRIKDRPSPYVIYSEKLRGEELITEDRVDRTKSEINECLERAFRSAHDKTCPPPEPRFFETWEHMRGQYSHLRVNTGVPESELLALARKLNAFPKNFTVNRKLERILNRRLESVETGVGIDWATGEALAFASLVKEGFPVRLSGQDCSRGTFSQRHSVVVDQKTGETFVPLNNLDDKQAPFQVCDSLLSENAVMGFEYGYSLASPDSLVIWEAQFGDFANNAQVIIDQYISSAEAKMQRLSGLTLFLPHGYEGEGPEHSSARVERYLQLCAEDNMQVCCPSTPAQLFHLLRRQMKRKFRKPLIVLTPKSLLRHPSAVSNLADLADGSFYEVIDDQTNIPSPRRVIVCSGKIYYELSQRRQNSNTIDCVILRLEQFYPFPHKLVENVISKYRMADEWFWVQDEPENMGGWSFVQSRMESLMARKISYIGRDSASSPATGHLRVHREQLSAILDKAVGKVTPVEPN